LADFQSAINEFEAEQITVIAASVDPMEKAKETAEKLKITYPLAYGLNAEAVSEITGVFYEEEKKFVQPANFLIRPDKTIEVACYSSGPIGRFAAKDVLVLVKFYKSRK
jgi:peroxiredoxin